MKQKFRIDKNGNLVGIHSDILHALNLGKLKNKRISNVAFNEETQQWEARRVGETQVLCTGKTYAEVVERERELLNPEVLEGRHV